MRQDDQSMVCAIMNTSIINGKNAYNQEMTIPQAETWFERLMNANYVSLCVVNEGQLIGWGTLSPYRSGRDGLAHVAEVTFYLLPEATGKGLGGKLLNALEKEAEKLGISVLLAILLADNVISTGFLIKHGYSTWAMFDALVKKQKNPIGHLYMGKRLGSQL